MSDIPYSWHLSRNTNHSATDFGNDLQKRLTAGDLVRKEVSDCIQIYNRSIVTQYSNLVLVTPHNRSFVPVPNILWYIPQPGKYMLSPPDRWDSPQSAYYSIIEASVVDGVSWPKSGVKWQLYYCNESDTDCMTTENISSVPTTLVQYCLVESSQDDCSLQLSTSLLVIVIAMNCSKVLGFVLVLLGRVHSPLVVLGDALASFLDRPDRFTQNMGPMSASEIRERSNELMLKQRRRLGTARLQQLQEWSGLNFSTAEGAESFHKAATSSSFNRKHTWQAGASFNRWFWTVFICIILWFVSVSYLLPENGSGDSLATLWSEGFNSIDLSSVIGMTKSLSLLQNIFLANGIQLAISCAYLSFNGLLTYMVLSREFITYGQKRRGRRVSGPTGHQRSPYWLSLPYRFSVPLLIFSSLMHWALSQTIFLVYVTALDPNGNIDQSQSVAGLVC